MPIMAGSTVIIISVLPTIMILRGSVGAISESGTMTRSPRALEGLDVNVVVTARDLGRQTTAHWQEEVKLGDTRSYADFEREQFRADVPGRSGGERPHFWHAQDYASAFSTPGVPWSTAYSP